ncbi:MAG: tetratricopeptide repeat protein [candidate division Zixibacteria bacterium]|nr:tetratricopeptide repeat protein [candidate division Zixibacteria bacterium]
MRRTYYIVAFILLTFFGAAAVVQSEEAEMTLGRYWYFVENIQVTGDSPELRLWAALPVEHRGQKVEIGEIYPEPAAVVEEPFGKTKIVFWRQTDLVDGEGIYFYYDFGYAGELVSGEDIDPEKVEPYDEASPEYQRYTQSEPWIEITDAIRAQAREIVGDEANSYRKAKKIFDWVVYNIAYLFPDYESRGAAKSFARRSGDCGEFSAVFCALCRAEGIPARTVICCWPWGGGHVWAEALIPPYGWVPVDTSMAAMFIPRGLAPATEDSIHRFMEITGILEEDPEWLFGNLYPNRLIVSIGNNLQVKHLDLGVAKVFRFLQPGGSGAYPLAEEYLGLSDKVVGAGAYVFGEERDDPAAAREKASGALGYECLRVGAYEKAEELARVAVEAAPGAEDSWLWLGQAYLGQGKLDAAIDAFHEALDAKGGGLKPIMDVMCHQYLGVCYQKKGDLEAARDEFLGVMASGIDYEGSLAFAEEHFDEVMLALE